MADEIFTDWDDDFSRLNGASFSSCCESAIHQCDSCANEAYMSAVSKIEDLYDKSDDFSAAQVGAEECDLARLEQGELKAAKNQGDWSQRPLFRAFDPLFSPPASDSFANGCNGEEPSGACCAKLNWSVRKHLEEHDTWCSLDQLAPSASAVDRFDSAGSLARRALPRPDRPLSAVSSPRSSYLKTLADQLKVHLDAANSPHSSQLLSGRSRTMAPSSGLKSPKCAVQVLVTDESHVKQSSVSNLACTPIQDAARQLAIDMETYLASARARVAGNVSPNTLSIETVRQKPSAFDENQNEKKPEEDATESAKIGSYHLQPSKSAPVQVAEPKVDFDRLVERLRSRLRTKLQPGWKEEVRRSAAKQQALILANAALNKRIDDETQYNRDLSDLLRANDTLLRHSCELQRRNSEQCALMQCEVRQLSEAFSERLKLESAAQSAIAQYEQFSERARSAKVKLDEASKKTVDAFDRLSKAAQAKMAEAGRERLQLQREAEVQRGELETRSRKLRVDIDALRASLAAKTNEAAELNQIIAELSAKLSEARTSSAR